MKEGKWDVIDLKFDGKILLIKPTEDVSYGLRDLNAFYAYLNTLINHQAVLFLSDYRDCSISLNSETIRYAAQSTELNKNKLAEALVVNSFPKQLANQFFFQLLRPKTRTQVFRNSESARNWLDSMRKFD